MKKIKIYITLLTVICAVYGLIGCQINGNIIGLTDYYYADSEKYSVGEAELTETVENIEISWMAGNVTVLTHNSNTVSFSEKSQKELTENTMLHYYLDNTTLRIKFRSSGKWDLSELDKELTLLVPNTLTINNLKVSTFSANVKLSNCAVSQNVTINTLSGETEAEFIEPLNEFNGSFTSGSVTVNAPSISRFDVDVVSSAVSLYVQKEPDWLDIETTSGYINLFIPESASFALDYDAKSGSLYSDLSYRRSSRKYIFGEGKGEYKIESVSGDVRIMRNAKEG